MPREPKILNAHQLRGVLQDWAKPLEALSKSQLVQVFVATRDVLRKTGEKLSQAEHRTCNHDGCHQKPIIWRCEEHAGEPPPPGCDECNAPATKCLCDEHDKPPAPPECDECSHEAEEHFCEGHAKAGCDECEKEATVSFCDEHNPADNLQDVVEALSEPVNTPEERVWRRHRIERLVEGAGFASPTIKI